MKSLKVLCFQKIESLTINNLPTDLQEDYIFWYSSQKLKIINNSIKNTVQTFYCDYMHRFCKIRRLSQEERIRYSELQDYPNIISSTYIWFPIYISEFNDTEQFIHTPNYCIYLSDVH